MMSSEVYGSNCRQCECAWDVSECPCRYTKDLQKVFGMQNILQLTETEKRRTDSQEIELSYSKIHLRTVDKTRKLNFMFLPTRVVALLLMMASSPKCNHSFRVNC